MASPTLALGLGLGPIQTASVQCAVHPESSGNWKTASWVVRPEPRTNSPVLSSRGHAELSRESLSSTSRMRARPSPNPSHFTIAVSPSSFHGAKLQVGGQAVRSERPWQGPSRASSLAVQSSTGSSSSEEFSERQVSQVPEGFAHAHVVPQPPTPQPYGVPERGVEPDTWDVVGLGQAMVDFSAMVSDDFLSGLGLPRGQRVVVDHKERGSVLQAMDGCAYKLSAGGSLSNTLVALARLGKGTVPAAAASLKGCIAPASQGRRKLHVSMVGSVGSDALGDFYRTKLLRANVHFLSPAIQGGTTGTVIVLTTPDAQRTMLSYQGMSSEVSWDAAMAAVVAKSRVLVVEGYLWELPQTVDAIEEACAAARSKGLLVALTASDASCVLRHRPKFWSVLCRSAHILFSNVQEARALAGCSESTSPETLAQYLSQYCPLVAVTDGEKGSYLGLRGQVVHIPAVSCTAKDSCGAGDAYAAGVLFALLMGAPDLESIGSIASGVSAVVVSQQGARLGEEDAEVLAQSMEFGERALVEGPVFHAMMGLKPVEDGVALNALP